VSTSRRIARVVLDTRLPQLDRIFDYLVPEGMDIAAGVRVTVPLRSQKRVAEGFVVEVVERSEHKGKLAELASVVSPVPVLGGALWDVAEAIASRSAGSPADVLRLAIPKRYVAVEKNWWARIGGSRAETEVLGDPADLPTPPSFLDTVLLSGARTFLPLPYGMTATKDENVIPRAAETVAVLAAHTLARSQSAVVVVPDWRDIEHYSHALAALIPEDRLVLASGDQPPAQRYAQYLRTLEQVPLVVLGNRHAVYSPAENLGLLVIVEDADAAHREPLAPYPHTRDIAMVRNTKEGVALCFASSTPSLAVERWIDMGHVDRVPGPHLHRPRVIPSALALGGDTVTSPARLPSSVYHAVSVAVAQGPVLVQVFRAGFSPGLSCEKCRARALCGHCGGPLRVPSKNLQPLCGWCGVVAAGWRCAECGSATAAPRGQGIGRTITDLGKSFPAVPVIRSDGEHPVSRVPHKPALVVATRGSEPVTEGGYPLVLLLDGAAMLQRDSLGALEESIGAWEHAISFAADDGVVYVTDLDGPPALALAAGNWSQLARHELLQRDTVRLPPAIRVAAISGTAGDVEKIHQALSKISPHLDALGPISTGTNTLTLVLRFPYSLGDEVTRELRAWRVKLAMGPTRNRGERVKIVVDDARALDALSGE